METFEKVISFLEDVANIVGSCRIYENLFSPGDLESTGRAMRQLLLLYVAILGFIAEANIYFSTPSNGRSKFHGKLVRNWASRTEQIARIGPTVFSLYLLFHFEIDFN